MSVIISLLNMYEAQSFFHDIGSQYE